MYLYGFRGADDDGLFRPTRLYWAFVLYDEEKTRVVEHLRRVEEFGGVIDINACEAGIVSRPEDYEWCRIAAAVIVEDDFMSVRACRSATAAFGTQRECRWKANAARNGGRALPC